MSDGAGRKSRYKITYTVILGKIHPDYYLSAHVKDMLNIFLAVLLAGVFSEFRGCRCNQLPKSNRLTMIQIGFVSYRQAPQDLFPPLRLRALLAEAALQGASLVLLDGSSYDRERGLIAGERWTSGGWTRGWLPLPDVVVQKTTAGDAQRDVEEWIRRSRPVIADSAMDKLKFHALLSGSPLASHAIPTIGIASDRVDDTLASFFRDHRNAVVKPANGRRGIGIQFIQHEVDRGEGGWVVRHGRDTVRGTLEDAVRCAGARIAGRLHYRRYLVQRFVRSVAADGRPADIRVHVQRRADGNWGVTRSYVRLAEAGMLVANVSQGGYQGPLDGFLLGRRSAAHLQDQIPEVALEVARLVDATKPLPLSELGIDLALDDEDRVWVIEANALPQASLHEHARAVHAIGYAMAVARGEAGHERSEKPTGSDLAPALQAG